MRSVYSLRISTHMRFIIWGVVVCIITVSLCVQLYNGINISTNILDLLPESKRDPVLSKSIRSFTENISKNIIFLIGHEDEYIARKAAKEFAAGLNNSSLFSSVRYQITDDDKKSFYSLYFPYRHQILSPKTRSLLSRQDGGKQLIQRAFFSLSTPLSGFYSQNISNDPLFLFPEYVKSIPKLSDKTFIQDDLIMVRDNNTNYVILSATTRDSPFTRTAQENVIELINASEIGIKTNHPTINFLWTGVFRFADESTSVMQREISVIGIGSIFGILLLMLTTFKSFRQLLLAILSIFIGVVTAFTISYMLFPNLHLLTLVFGASLIGVCIDYSFHYFSESLLGDESWTPENGLNKIFSGITLGAVTSIIGYIGLCIAPFPGLRQMALFSSIGILASYSTVICWYPSLSKKNRSLKTPLLLRASNAYLQFWEQFSLNRWRWLPLVIILLLIVAGLSKLKSNDDVRLLQNIPPHLLNNEKSIRGLIGGLAGGRFLIVQGDTAEETLQREENVSEYLSQLKERGIIKRFMGISTLIPSQQKQLENWRMLKDNLVNPGKQVLEELNKIGFPDKTIDSLTHSLSEPPTKYLSIKEWNSNLSSEPYRHLWLGEINQGHGTIIQLDGVTNEQEVKNLEEIFANVKYVNEASVFTELFQGYRRFASKLVICSYGVIFLLLIIRYGIKKGFLIILSPVLAALMALAVAGLHTGTFNLFNIISLLLVLGIGIDYTIFFAESKSGRETVMLAVLLSAITSILSFGLLALTTTPILKSIGTTILVGITAALIFSPMVQQRRESLEKKVAKSNF